MPNGDAPCPFAIAGIPFVHRGEAGLLLPECITPDWKGSRVTHEPICVYHSVGDTSTDGLTPIIATPLPLGDFYIDADERLAIKGRGAGEPVDRPQLLRTRRSGFEYTINYGRASDALRMQWGWHRTIFMFALPLRRRGLSLHATAFILPDGRGVACPGVSGAGKSTLARAMLQVERPGLTVIGDDRIALTSESGGLRLWGTPWHSSAGTSVAADAPCNALVFVGHGDRPTLAPMSKGEAARRVLRTIAIPFWDAAATGFALEMVNQLVTSVPCFEFSYAPGPRAGAALVSRLIAALPALDT